MDKSLLISSFEQALKNLTNVLQSPAKNDLEKAGCIQYFEFCFELAWKSIRIITTNQGIADCWICYPRAIACRIPTMRQTHSWSTTC